MKSSSVVITTLLGLALLISPAQTLHAKEQKFGDDLRAMAKKVGGCSRVKSKLREYSKEFPDFHFAFAARKDSTLTGIRGCGYGWSKKKSSAEAIAMKFCKKMEKKYGTDGGKKTCRLFKL